MRSAAADSDEQVAATVETWEKRHGLVPPQDWPAVVADEQELDYEGVIRITTFVEMKRLLTDLKSIAPHDRVDVIDRQLERLAAAAETAMDHEQDVNCAGRRPQGNRGPQPR